MAALLRSARQRHLCIGMSASLRSYRITIPALCCLAITILSGAPAATTGGGTVPTSTFLSASKANPEPNEPVTFSAHVQASIGGTFLDGTVTFDFGDGTPPVPATCEPPALASYCDAQVSHAYTTPGSYVVVAQYAGNVNGDPSLSNGVTETVTACSVNPVVTANADAGPGSLRQAMADSCGYTGTNTITFDMGSVASPITLTSGELTAGRSGVIVSGPGARTLTINRDGGAGAFRIFHALPGRNLEIRGVRISDGAASGGDPDGWGGGILGEGASVTLSGVAVTNNSAENGAGVALRAIGHSVTLTIVDSTISTNFASAVGGGVAIMGTESGGRIASLEMSNTTVSGNEAGTEGGGVATRDRNTVRMTNVTVTNNCADGGPDSGGGFSSQTTLFAPWLRSVIVAGNYNGESVTTADDYKGPLDGASISNLIGGDPRLAPLDDNGGQTDTHALLTGSPAIDAGSNQYANGLSFDQRGTDFGRLKDGPDADTFGTVDIGAYEADPAIEDISDKSTNEDTPLTFTFRIGDASAGTFVDLFATSSNTTLVPNDSDHISITGTGQTRTLQLTPVATLAGTSTITVTYQKSVGGLPFEATDTFELTVNDVNDAPTLDAIAPLTIGEDAGAQTVGFAGISSGAVNESQGFTVTATSNNHSLIADPSVTYTSPDAGGSLAFTPVADAFGTATITVRVQDDGGTDFDGANATVRTFTVTVSPLADTPTIESGATTLEDTQSTSGLVIRRNAADGSEVPYVKVTDITNGRLFLNDGVTEIHNGDFVLFDQTLPGLRFTPVPDFFGSAGFNAQASVTADDGGLGGSVVAAPITVLPVADTPSATDATTTVQVQTASGLVLTRSPADGSEVTHFRISGIADGRLFLNDGATEIHEGDFITASQGGAGLKFTPADGFIGDGGFGVQAATGSTVDTLGGGVITANIEVTRQPSVTTIVSADPNPSDQTQPITVAYTVESFSPLFYSTYMPAAVVVGQSSFVTGSINQGGSAAANTLRSPAQTLVVNGKLLIADSQNNRVLVFNAIPTTDNASADVVIGQTSLTGTLENQGGAVAANTLDRPSGLATDGTRLFVLDRDNHRVLVYNTVPTANNASADVVIGHSTMTDASWCGEGDAGNTTGVAADCLSAGPTGLLYDAGSGKLVVYDSDNNRVLIYNSVPTTNGAPADVVIGQADFTQNVGNRGGAAAADTLDLSTASGLGSYGGKLLIADRLNNRVLVYNSFPTANGASADVVIGQTNFTDTAANGGGPVSAWGLDQPRGAQVDAQGRLFIPEANNSRVLVFNSIPTTNGASADLVIGQPDFGDNTPRTTRQGLGTFPYEVSFTDRHLIVTDQGNHRVLVFTNDSGIPGSAGADSPAPAGFVTVTMSGGGESCTGTVAEGQCTLTPIAPGVREITATYAGDLLTIGSVSAPFAHAVSGCSIDPVVTTTADGGNGSLRAAIAAACYGSTITFNIPGAGPHSIVLTGGVLVLTKNVTIAGSAAPVRISGDGASRIFDVALGVTAAIDRLTLADGYGDFGGVMRNWGVLTITGSTLADSRADLDGGAIANSGRLTIRGSTLAGNRARSGGAIVSMNAANPTDLTIVNSTISGNTAVQDGGGIKSTGTAFTLTHVTITGNTAGLSEGGVFAAAGTIANSIIAGNSAPATPDLGGVATLAGVNVTSGDPLLGPLQNNGGPTLTHAPLAGSPALDAGDNDVAVTAGLTADQRGAARFLDAADADTNQAVDVGAVEADPIVEVLTSVAIDEDGVAVVTFNVGDATTAFDSIVAASGNTTLLPNTAGRVDLTGGDSTRTLTLTPLANQSGSALVTVTATKTFGGVPLTSTTSFTLTVNAVDDPPALAAIPNPAAIPEDSALQTVNFSGVSAGPGEVQALSVTAVSDNTALIPNPTVSYTSPDATGSLSYTPVANKSGTATITVTVSDGHSTAVQTFTVTVTAVPDAPGVTPNLRSEEDGGSQLIRITRNPADGSEVTHFRITNITGGTLVRNSSGLPQVNNGDFLTVAQGSSGLIFVPSPNSIATGHFTVEASIGSAAGALGAPVTADVLIDPVPDTPTVTPATTPEDTQSTTGLVITRNAADGPEVSHFKILDVFNGSLFQHDGLTAIPVNGVITAAQAAAGLRFTPNPNYFGGTTFLVIGVLDAAGTFNGTPGLAGGVITVTAVADTPSITNATTTVNTQTTSGLVVTRNAADGAEIGFVKISAISGGSLFQNDGTTPIGPGSFITMSQAQAGLRFSPSPSSVATGHVTIQASRTSTDAGLGGATVTADIVVNQLTSTTTVATSGSPSNPGQTVTFTATVTPALAGASGTVQFKDGSASLGSPVSLSGGAASFSTSSLTPGQHQISAVYSGNSVAAGSTGNLAGGQLVSCPTMTIAPSAVPAAQAGTAYSQTFTQSDGLGPIVFSMTGTTPPGLAFNASSATLSGTPTSPGSYAFQVTATPSNGCGAVSASYTLLVGGGRAILTGADAGAGPHVRRFGALDGAAAGTLNSFFAFNHGFTGGVRVAEGDVNGDGVPDPIAAAGPGAGPEVHVYDGATGALLRSFFAFEASFTGGVFVAAGDVNGDGYSDVIAGSGAGRASEIKVFSGRDGGVLRDTFVFSSSFAGVQVAAGDVNGDGFADLVAGSGPGTASAVTVLSGADLAVLRTFSPYGPFTGGVFVASGDVTGDGYADVITGAGAGGGPHVQVFDGVSGGVVRSFFALAAAFTGGVRVAAGDVTGDGKAEIIVGAGPGGSPEMRVFDGVTTTVLSAQLAYPPAFTGGVFVATAVPQPRMAIERAGTAGGAGGATAPGADRRPDMVTGWAGLEGAQGSGISAVHVYAQPVSGGAAIYLGAATLGDARPDVAARYGQQYGNAGFHLSFNRATLPAGAYDIIVFARSAQTVNFQIARTLRVTITP